MIDKMKFKQGLAKYTDSISEDFNSFIGALYTEIKPFLLLPYLETLAMREANKLSIPVTINYQGKADYRGNNDMRDAFRHAYISGFITFRIKQLLHLRSIARNVSAILGDAVEVANEIINSSSHEKLFEEIDLYNNAIGRKIGENASSEIDLRDKVFKALVNKRLRKFKRDEDHFPLQSFDKTGTPLFTPLINLELLTPKPVVPKFKPQRSPEFELRQMEMQIKQEIQKLIRSESLRLKSQLKRSMQSATSTMMIQNRARHANFSPFSSRGITKKSRGQIGKEMWHMLAKGLRNM